MSVTTIVFSRDRPAQLDLLLRSMKANAPAFFKYRPWVVARVDDEYYRGYHLLWDDWPDVRLTVENPDQDFRTIVGKLLREAASDKVAFFVDDDVIYRPLPVPHPSKWLDLFPDTLCFSLRLGLNTDECYSMGGVDQGLPLAKTLGHFLSWDWRDPQSRLDWAYPGSLDGHIWRRDDLLRLLDGEPFTNPNQLEEVLMHGCRQTIYPSRIASFKESVLVGIPANSVSETHGSNRHGNLAGLGVQALNEGYLAGGRLEVALGTAERDLPVVAAHAELPLVWGMP